jgi:hypothetical protein
MKEIRRAQTVLAEKVKKRRDNLRDVNVDGRIILKCPFRN